MRRPGSPSGMTSTQRQPFTAQTMARPTPVLPEVGSTTVPEPGLRLPLRSASLSMPSAMRSLTEPPGLAISTLAHRRAPPAFSKLLRRTKGVRPIRSSTDSARLRAMDALSGAGRPVPQVQELVGPAGGQALLHEEHLHHRIGDAADLPGVGYVGQGTEDLVLVGGLGIGEGLPLSGYEHG